MQGAQDIAWKSCIIRQLQQSRLVHQNHELLEATPGINIHFLAGKFDRRSPHRPCQSKATPQQLTPQMGLQWIMFTVKNHPSRGNEVDLAAIITRL